MTRRLAFLLVVFVTISMGRVVLAQTTTATLAGKIQDPSGAVVPGVKVSARNANTAATRETETDTAGRYSLTNLEPGQYEVRAERAGFKTVLQPHVVLSVGGTAILDITLEVGTVNETV